MRLAIFFAVTGLAFAQPDNNTLTITASRNVNVVPDQVALQVRLRAETSAALSDVLAQMAGSGITAANLTYVSTHGNLGDNRAEIDWSFELVVPFSGMKDSIATLAALTRKLGLRNGSPVMTVSVTDSRISDEAQSQACPLTALVSDARRQAEQIASATGVRVGAIVGLSDGAGNAGVEVVVADFPAVSFLAYDSPFGATLARGYPMAPNRCSMIVQFRLIP
jgi:uncharacterized protein YggE